MSSRSVRFLPVLARWSTKANGRITTVAFVVSVALVSLFAGASAALADVAWKVDAMSNTTVAPGAGLSYLLQITNMGEDTGAFPQLSVTLPAGMTFAPGFDLAGAGLAGCTPADPSGASSLTCTWFAFVERHSLWQTQLPVVVDPGVSPGTLLTSSFTVSAGGASNPSTTVDTTRVSPTPPGFGVAAFDGQESSDAAGDALTQAGGHPYAASVSIDFNTLQNPNPTIGALWPVEATRDVVVDLPAGLAGYPPAAAKCTAAQLVGHFGGPSPRPLCPPSSQVGTTLVRVNGFGATSVFGPVAVYNMFPPPGVPARFGFNIAGSVVSLDAQVRADANYSLGIASVNVPESLPIASTTTTLWGVPADPAHDGERACPGQPPPFSAGSSGPTCSSGAPPVAFLRNPTSCEPPTPGADGLMTTTHIDSWVHPGALRADGSPDLSDPAWQSASFVSHLPPAYPNPPSAWGAHQLPTGCEKEPFTPSIQVQPSSHNPASPTGLDVTLSMPQDAASDPNAISQADLRKAVVTLPEGMTVNPSAAAGLGACTSAQIGLGSNTPASCPDSSKIGSLQIETPALSEPLHGSVYLAAQSDNPFHSLLAIYLVAKGPGVELKVPGRVEADASTGRLTTTFDKLPQLPFSSMHMVFDPGSLAPLATPATCGEKSTTSTLEGWNGKTATISNPYTVECTSGLGGFSPSFDAGTLNPQAASFSPFVANLARSDGQQFFGGITTSLPAGALARLAGVPFCPQPAIAAAATRTGAAEQASPSCPAASLVGHVTVGAGVGSSPFSVAGNVYFAGPYAGAPFSLAIVTPAVAGPLDLGTVVVRAALYVDPSDAHATVVSDALPSILQGIPLDIRTVSVAVDREGFTFNPTNCNPLAVGGLLTSTGGATATLSSPFQAANCAALPFKPSFSVSTSARTSKVNGASLHVHLATNESPGSSTNEANIAKVDVQLPVVLPSRLSTLQKACTEAQFNANPSGCPEGAFVGTATAHTPILNSPLSGPAILVSHGGAAFPDLVIMLQGEGVRLNLVGNTQIKNGVTFSRFETVPDAPVSSFDLELPEGPHSALTVNGGLCGKTVTVKRRVTRRVHGHKRRALTTTRKRVAASLLMPTTITAQNGAVLKQNTRIAVTGCAAPTARKATKKKTKAKHAGKGTH